MKYTALLLLITISGCFGTLAGGASPRAATADTPQIDKCRKAYRKTRDSYNGHATWTNRMAVAAILIGAGTILVNGIDSKSQPGSGASDVMTATEREGRISGLEITGIVLASATAITTGVTSLQAKWMSDDTSKLDKVTQLINRLSPVNGAPPANPPNPGELLECE